MNHKVIMSVFDVLLDSEEVVGQMTTFEVVEPCSLGGVTFLVVVIPQ